MRCNPKFHDAPRYDFVLINDDSGNLTVAQLRSLFTCKLANGSAYDIALVRMLKPNAWRPKTMWEGCRVYQEQKGTQFVMLEYLLRGAFMVPAFDSNKPSLLYLNDLVDADMFLRAGN